MNIKESLNLLLRYVILVIVAFPSLFLFYAIFTPLTVYSTYFVLNLFYNVVLMGNSLIINNSLIELIPACIAGSAYYLLLILNLTTPMELKTRIRSLSFLFISFLALNILRLVIFSSLFVQGFQYFDIAHKTTWYLGSTLLVVILWFVNVRIFNIKSVPAYTDLHALFRDVFPKKSGPSMLKKNIKLRGKK